MRLFQISLLLQTILFCYCKKNDSGTSLRQTSFLSVGNVSKTRDSVNSTIRFVISVENPNSKPITFDYATQEGTAKANVDFIPVSGTLTISPNSNQTTIIVTVIGRKLNQSTSNFYSY